MEGPWGSTPPEATPHEPAPAGIMRGLLLNLRAGRRVARFKPVGQLQFTIDGSQVLASAGIAVLLILAYCLARWQHFGYLGYAVESGWLGKLGASCFLFLVIAYAISVFSRHGRGTGGFCIIAISSLLAPAAAFIASIGAMTPIATYAYTAEGMTWLYEAWYAAYVALFLWCVGTMAQSLRVAYRLKGMAPAVLSLLLIGVFFLPDMFEADASSDEDGESAIPYDLDVETTFYAQPGLVDRAAAGLAAEEPGITDLYFVGFGSYATQNVFRSEVEKVAALFADRFGAGGRSVILINHADTVDTVPVASVSNLKRLLPEIAARMNKDEDILFFFLTSHGSPGDPSVDFFPLQLNDLHADELDRMLDESGIKWRVIVVSACYSGSFIEPLKDDNSLIITAARADRTSFGCSNENEYTYFGDAYFNQALRQQRDFIAAFEQARKTIAARESAEDLTPSEPQIHVGAALRERLKEFENRLSTVSSAGKSAGG
jgi:Peptidase C13 family